MPAAVFAFAAVAAAPFQFSLLSHLVRHLIRLLPQLSTCCLQIGTHSREERLKCENKACISRLQCHEYKYTAHGGSSVKNAKSMKTGIAVLCIFPLYNL